MKNLKFEKIGKELTKEEMKSVVGGTSLPPDTGNKTWDTFSTSSGAYQTDDDKTPFK